MRIRGLRVSETGSSRRGAGEDAGGRGGSPVWSPPARDPLQSPLNLRGLRVWQRCLEKGSAEAALPLLPLRVPPPPSRAPSPSPPSARAPRRPPFSDGARGASPRRNKLGRASRLLREETWGPLGTGGSIPCSVPEPRSCPGARISPGGWPGLERPPRGTERTCRSAWSEDCSVAAGGGRLGLLAACS